VRLRVSEDIFGFGRQQPFFSYLSRTCGVIVTSFGEKTCFSLCQKICGIYSKSRGAETQDDGNNVSPQKVSVVSDHNFAKIIEKLTFFQNLSWFLHSSGF